ncbi:hypothetical protein SAMN03159338_1563 [Sphingomonas sp. NFR04]|uniref:hypothetical protein n=1 Tax=Sphingomonas sp. NFR04 TaxID=1566283 RepID=UPI0008F2A73D|nr:hypothetical protein [Sphingomonas sp. NFR04]SFJ49548.1 hypothetical protein SAMN03159338_1563 [Sphingomonas sp. NFR04]
MSKKAPAVQVTADMISKAANTSTVKDLVKLAAAFARASVHGPYPVELPILCACAVKEKGYRRHSVPTGTRVNAKEIRLGKRDGLIFVMPVDGEWVCDKGPVEWIELAWDDIINCFGDLAERVESYLDGAKVADIQAAVVDAIKKNAAMHKILSEGFVVAQQDKKEQVTNSIDQSNPLWGQF